ncbi:MAG: hypothetical protein AUK63_1720 [bacterium P3]|nr:MAG: hypothetical protein AUK63_1720 [bacterium P3]KWW38907.1 MAG: hypothetical protein F083_2026 [bacterium F083]
MPNLRSYPALARLLILAGTMLLAWVAAAAVTLALPQLGLDDGDRRLRLGLQALTQTLVFLLPSLLFAHLFHGGTAFFGCTIGRRQWTLVAIGIASLLLLTPAVDWLSVWNNSWHWGGRWAAVETQLRGAAAQAEALTLQLLTMPRPGDLLLCLLVVALVPAVCEEVLFRGVIQQTLQLHWRNIHAAVWTTALIFSLLHGDLFALLPRMALGALLGYLYALSGSLSVSAAVHFVNNAVIVILHYLHQHHLVTFSPDDTLSLPLLLSVCCAVAAGILLHKSKPGKPEQGS